ncbi:hypothetical protein OEZ85_006352 [Tetradesmus obliquus]|uniref:Uncharacterized protein n=1 Tax=Tetradesmus obliquus TaxID=3088 RepID=A0ABY8TWD8_TETOB|nr:hypothetical protein OEZ85_006352 [Tetradesmus obliquus]
MNRRFDKICSVSAAAASQLNKLWKQPAQVKLLQQPPPAKVNPKLAGLLQQTAQHVSQLTRLASEAWDTAVLLNKQQQPWRCHPMLIFVEDLLAASPMPVLAQLLQWLQQRPELLQLQDLAATEGGDGDGAGNGGSYSVLWVTCVTGLRQLLNHILQELSSNSRALAKLGEDLMHARLPQQLPGRPVLAGSSAAALAFSEQLLPPLPEASSTLLASRHPVEFCAFLDLCASSKLEDASAVASLRVLNCLWLHVHF